VTGDTFGAKLRRTVAPPVPVRRPAAADISYKIRMIGAVLLLGACAGERAPNGSAAPAAAVAPSAARGAPGSPEAALAAYLEASREGSATAGALDTLLGCDARGAFVLPVTMLGAYRVLPAGGAGDTLLGRAVVVTVAEQRADRRDRDRYVARQRVEEDTFEWDLVRGDGRWTVCNGVQFGFHQPDDATTWFPLGASRATARRLADSVYRAWTPAR
jgi:hypothetical protein